MAQKRKDGELDCDALLQHFRQQLDDESPLETVAWMENFNRRAAPESRLKVEPIPFLKVCLHWAVDHFMRPNYVWPKGTMEEYFDGVYLRYQTYPDAIFKTRDYIQIFSSLPDPATAEDDCVKGRIVQDRAVVIREIKKFIDTIE